MFNALAPSWSDDVATTRFLARYERNSATPEAASAIVALASEIDTTPALSSITAPTLVLHREGDAMVPFDRARDLADAIPGARLVTVPGSDHLVFVDSRPVIDEVTRFVTGVAPAPEPERLLTTLLFMDVVGSTEIATRMGDAPWRDVLASFYARARSELSRAHGEEIVTTGDGLLATFDGPARAVRCGLDLSRSVASLGLQLRCGVHTAEVERLGDDIVGLGVHVGARVTAAATPGEVWTTRTVRDLVAGSGLEFTSRGKQQLRGVAEPWDLYAAVA